MDQWWSHEYGFHWPADRSRAINSLVLVFKSLGYEECDDDKLESGFERVVLYCKGTKWMHAARQIETGEWTSKLGIKWDIAHKSPEALCDYYGPIHCYMKRQRTSDGQEEARPQT